MTAEFISLGIFLILIALGARVILKSLGRRFVGLDQQLRELTRQLSEQQRHDAELSRKIETQDRTIGELSAKIEAQSRTITAQIDEQNRATAELTARLEAQQQALSENSKLAPVIDPAEIRVLANRVAEVSQKFTALSESVEHLKTPAETFPIDPEFLRTRTEPEMIALAESLPALRPLLPYPNWRFDIDWDNSDPLFKARRQIWQAFHDRAIEAPITITWHFGTQLHLYLGNDASRQIYVAGCIDPNEFAFLSQFLQPGMMFLDGGANEGTYTVFAASRVGASGNVWAFEPSLRELERLRSNLALNNFTEPNVRVFPLALADCHGSLVLTLAESDHAGQNTLGEFANEGIEASGHQTIPARRLDEVVEEHSPERIDFLKLDVEGAELRALKGAVATLRRYRPVILLEVSEGSLQHQGASREGLIAFLRAHDYSPYRFNSSGVPVAAESGAFSDNMIAVPDGTDLAAGILQG